MGGFGESGVESTFAQINTAKSLLDNEHNSKASINDVKRKQLIDMQGSKNLLDKQLATRRAQLGAMGVSSSASAAAVQNEHVVDYQKDIMHRRADDDSTIRGIKRRRNQDNAQSAIDNSYKMAKSFAKIV